MKKYLLPFCLLLLFYSCDQTTSSTAVPREGLLHLLPHPKMISSATKQLHLSEASKLYSPDPELAKLLDLFQSELKKLTDLSIDITTTNNKEADIIFQLDKTLAAEAYAIDINKSIRVSGGSYAALTMAKSSLLQLSANFDGALTFPMVNIKDHPDVAYRGLMIDLARQWHTTETTKKLIDLAAYYKIKYVQLHFTDYQSYTLPSDQYPKLPTPDRNYSKAELMELEDYAQLRGVTIIPEVDVPGHSSPFVKMYPEIFAIQDTVNNPWIINMGKEEVYEALDHIIGDLTSIFKSSPYFHIGGDEAIFNKVDEDPSVQAYMKANELGTDVHDLYRHFLVRMNNIVKRYDKQMCVWEGFRREGKVDIPKDIIVFEFETNRYLPNELVEDGYTVVNTSWKPLYVVNKKKWEPKTIYDWNIWRWENWWPEAPSFKPIQVKETPLIIGAQMCAWEQPDSAEIPSLRKRLPAFSERIWNTKKKMEYDDFLKQMKHLDAKLSILINDTRQDSLLFNHNFEKQD